jgi:glutathione S-transferase
VRRLVTIGPSHYCEKARWALHRAGLPFREDAHVPGLHLLTTRRLGGRSVPLLVDGDQVYTDSTPLLDYLQTHPGAAWKPWPEPSQAARAWEERFDAELGPHTRRLAYAWLLPERGLILRTMTPTSARWEDWALRAGLPAFRRMIERGLRITPGGVARSRDKVLAVFQAVAEARQDGRPYLEGDRFTAADLSFAALAAPVLLPENAGWPYPAAASLPAAVRQAQAPFLEHPAGQWALRLFDEERWVVG